MIAGQIWDLIKTIEIIWDRLETWRCLKNVWNEVGEVQEKVSTLAWSKKWTFVWNFISKLPTCLKQVLDGCAADHNECLEKSLDRTKKSQSRLKLFHVPDMIPDNFHCGAVMFWSGSNPWPGKDVDICHTRGVQCVFLDLGGDIWLAVQHACDRCKGFQAWSGTNVEWAKSWSQSRQISIVCLDHHQTQHNK